MLSARSTSDASESLLGADDVSYAATDSTEESYGHFDARHGDYDDFQLHARYATGQRRQAIQAGSRDWGLAMMRVDGTLNEANEDEHLDMANNGVSIDELAEMCKELAHDPDLKSIDLSGNMLGLLHPDGCPPPRPPDGHQYPDMPAVRVLADAIRENDALTRVNVSRNCLGDLGQLSLRNLIDACKGKKNLAILDLSANGILGPEGNRMPSMAYLCKTVLPGLHLMHLSLAYNELHSEALKLLTPCTMGNTPQLRALLCVDLASNRVSEEPRGDYDPSGVRLFSRAICSNMTLTALNLSDNRLGNAECECVVAAAAQMQTLKALHLDDNLIHAQGACAVQEHLFADEHLEWLDLSGNPITDDGATHIAEMINLNTKLHTLGLARCGLGEGTCKLLDVSLEVNTSLTRLDFSENDVTAMRERYVNDSCKANRELLSCRDRPRHYLYNEQRGITRKHLVKKIHHLDKAKLRQLLANPTFTNDKLMHRRLLELVPPDRHKLVFRCVRVWRRENRVRERKQLGGEGRREYLFGRV